MNGRNYAVKAMTWAFHIVFFLTVLTTQGVFAQSDLPRDATWVTNGPVRAIASTPTLTYIGGTFTYVGPNTGGGAVVDSSTGEVVLGSPTVTGLVQTCVPDGSGGWYIGGAFTKVGRVNRSNIAHILADGTVDPAWNPAPSGSIMAMQLSGNHLYVGGNFTSIGGQTRSAVAALDRVTGAATAWNPNPTGTAPVVGALVVSGSTVYVGGNFDSIGGQPRQRIAAVDAVTGNATAWSPEAGGFVSAIVVVDGTVYVGGQFTTIGGKPRNHIAAVDSATGDATAWNPNASGSALVFGIGINALAVSENLIYVGGNFDSIGGQARWGIAALDLSTGLATAWNPTAKLNPNEANPNQTDGIKYDEPGEVHGFEVVGDKVYVAGSFTTIGGQQRRCVAVLDTATGSATAWNPRPEGLLFEYAPLWTCSVVRLSGNAVYVGGGFYTIGGKTRNGIAALDRATGAATEWNPDVFGDPESYSDLFTSTVNCLDVAGSTVYVGGAFDTVGGQTRWGIAAVDGTTGEATSWDPHFGDGAVVFTLRVSGNTVYVGGAFNSIGGLARWGIAALDITTGNATAWDPKALGNSGTTGWVYALQLVGSTVYAGGAFDGIGGQPRCNIAALDAGTGAATAWNPSAGDYYGSVSSLLVSGNTVYMGGSFSSVGGQNRNCIAAVDVTTGNTTAWNPPLDLTEDFPPHALATAENVVYVGADNFGIVALDKDTGELLPWCPMPGQSCRSLHIDGNTLYIGGEFVQLGGLSRCFFAEFSIVPTYVVVPDVVGQDLSAAEAAMTEIGLIVGTVTSLSSISVPAGHIMSQEPVAETEVPEGTVVALVVASGPESIAVPDVVGQPLATAQSSLSAAGLVAGTVTEVYSATVPAGEIISQNPLPGASVPSGTAVALVVSKGIEPGVVPNVVGQPLATAEAKLSAAGLVVGTVTEAYSATVPAGNVISQNPAAGTRVGDGSAVTLVISIGEEPPTFGCYGGT
ncbi:MAG: PASTA domain-containing protein [Candidatus Hydrogenedentes bacterium]|nr:PASTA domain-containing protein [Candidatus Hydrogenedentota bacterium]